MPPPRESQIYFISSPDGAYVKIGRTTLPLAERLLGIGCGLPGLRLLAAFPGSYKTETALHRRFIADHEQYEWFRLSPAIKAFIDEIAAQSGPPIELTEQNIYRNTRLRIKTVSHDPNPTASQMGRKGGTRSMEILSPEQRRERAKLAANTRWGNIA